MNCTLCFVFRIVHSVLLNHIQAAFWIQRYTIVVRNTYTTFNWWKQHVKRGQSRNPYGTMARDSVR